MFDIVIKQRLLDYFFHKNFAPPPPPLPAFLFLYPLQGKMYLFHFFTSCMVLFFCLFYFIPQNLNLFLLMYLTIVNSCRIKCNIYIQIIPIIEIYPTNSRPAKRGGGTFILYDSEIWMFLLSTFLPVSIVYKVQSLLKARSSICMHESCSITPRVIFGAWGTLFGNRQ